MKFKKYNEGGGFVYTPFLFNIGAEASQPTTTTSGSSKKTTNKDDGFDFDKALLDAIKTNGIPSDYEVFIKEVSKMMTSLQYQEALTGQESSPIAQLSAIYGLANRVKENKASYDTAVQTLQNNQAWSEVATSTNGDMYVLTSKGISTVSPTEYYNNADQYQALTNGQLMDLRRRRGAGLEFQEGILIDMSNATSMKQINEYLRAIIKDFGTTKMSGYTNKQHSSIQSGLNQLLNEPDGYYKYSAEYQVENSEKDVKAALMYLYDSLPQNMKNLIVAKTAAEKGNPTSNDVYSILASALQRHTKSSTDITYDSSANKDANEKNNSGKTVQSTYLENIMTGKNYTYSKFNISPEQATVQLSVSGYNIGRLVDDKQNAVAANNVLKLSEISQTLLAGDLTSVSFGNQLMESEDLNALVWNGVSDVRIVDLPTIEVKGRIVPDFDSALALQEISQNIANGLLTNVATIQRQIDDRIGPGRAKFDPKTNTIKFDPRRQAKFITFSAYASDNNIAGLEDNELLAKLTRQEGSKIQDLYNRLVQWGGLSEGKGESVFHQGDANKRGFYQGNVFIRMNDPIHGQAFTNPQYHPMSDYQDVANKMRLRHTQDNFITNF